MMLPFFEARFMAGKKAFTLIEILVVLIIVGILLGVAIPNLMVFMEQTKAQTAKNNLLAIVGAQQRYFEDTGSYYINGANPTCADHLGDLSSNLRLGFSTYEHFLYSCWSNTPTASYTCTACDGTGAGAPPLTVASGGSITCTAASNNLCAS